MMSTNGSSRPIQLSSQLLSGSLVVQSTLCSVSSASSLSLGKSSRTVVVNFDAVLQLAGDAVRAVGERELDDFVLLDGGDELGVAELLASVGRPHLVEQQRADEHGEQHRNGPARPTRAERAPLPPAGGCGPGCWPRPGGGGGGGGGRLLMA